MSDEVTLKRQSIRGRKAKGLLEDELMQSALNDIRMTIYKKIETSDFNQKDEREHCYRMLRAAEMFEGMLKRHINTGIAAEEKLSFLQRVVKRVQEF